MKSVMSLTLLALVAFALAACEKNESQTNQPSGTTAQPPARTPATQPTTPAPAPTAVTPESTTPTTRPTGAAPAAANGTANTAAATDAESKIRQVMDYIRDNKLDAADAALKQLENNRASLPASLQSRIDSARTALNAARSRGNLPQVPGVAR